MSPIGPHSGQLGFELVVAGEIGKILSQGHSQAGFQCHLPAKPVGGRQVAFGLPAVRVLLLGSLLFAEVACEVQFLVAVAPDIQFRIDHGHHQRPAPLLRLGDLLDGNLDVRQLFRADAPRARTAQHRSFADDQFVTRQRDQRRIRPCLVLDKGDGPNLAGVQTGQIRGQPQAICGGPAGTIDDHAHKIGFFSFDLVAQAPFQPTDCVRLDLADHIHSQRTATLSQGRILDKCPRSKPQGGGQLRPVADDVTDKTKFQTQSRSTEFGHLARWHDPCHLADRRLLLHFLQLVFQNITRPLQRLYSMDDHAGVQHPKNDGDGDRASSLGDFAVRAAERFVDEGLDLAGAAKLGFRIRDDLLTSQHGQHGMATDRAIQISHGSDSGESFP